MFDKLSEYYLMKQGQQFADKLLQQNNAMVNTIARNYAEDIITHLKKHIDFKYQMATSNIIRV